MATRFNTPRHSLHKELVAELSRRGYPHDERRVPFQRYLAETLTAMTGQPVSENQTPVASMVAQLRYLITGRYSPAETTPMETALADIATADGLTFALIDGDALQLVDGGPFSQVGT